ncbi:hypothetical protein A4H97_14065 [Niastella yeongjuensis]|uniref:Secretion system C-terminal sorting domain-containing protein n=1 Tax=Niastella yeongjuensis TaxID=354355 RepID=A0A1V9E3V6_9BACT|nr:SBBP repeat-containing protein [Niastella yeongjuensis]OQP40741.1 hypothetical protein A4H97_14065 [Niastella yeongjuensis]SEP03034.1 delta-60 repeat domain-containing protein/Por secretion system C-terminal sorting domain-containing protein [Niastella yeongjuensis]
MTNFLRPSWRRSLLFAVLVPVMCFAQVNQQWAVRYNGPASGADAANRVVVDASGNVYVTGSSYGIGTENDYSTIKYNAAGVQQWEARYNGPGNVRDIPSAIAVDNYGNVYVTGTSGDFNAAEFALSYATIKYNSAGAQQWAVTYKSPGNGFDGAQDIAVDANGNVFVTGTSTGLSSGSDFTTIKYNKAGIQQWLARYNGPANGSDGATGLAIDKYGNVYVTGGSTGIGTNMDFTTIKYNVAGVQQWVARYNNAGNTDESAVGVAIDPAGNVYITGSINGDYATIKYNSNGHTQWVKRYNGSLNYYDAPLAIAADEKSNVYVTGISNMEPFFDPGDPSSAVFATIKYDSSGNKRWVARYDGPQKGYDRAHAIALDAAGNIYVTGESRGIGTGIDYATVKYNNDGKQQWEARYNGPGNTTDGATSVAVDALGNVYVTGSSYGIPSETQTDFATIKYSQASIVCCNKDDNVLVCHMGKTTICISKCDVREHLAHGDKLGECTDCTAKIAGDGNQPSLTDAPLPDHLRIYNAPNPAYSSTRIYFEQPEQGHVTIKVFDMQGKEIITLLNADTKAGAHNSDLDVSNLSKGVYLYRITLKTPSKVWIETGKISVVK